MTRNESKALGLSLREALSARQLRLRYQPQVNLADRSLHAIEALTRWPHPVHGDVPAGRFIAAAEREGLIEDIGLWALGEACRQWAEWRNGGWLVPAIAVNISPLQFRDPHLIAKIDDILRRHEVPSRHLVLEVTEGTALEDDILTSNAMNALRERGIGLSMDDFGTGYSSFLRLMHLPVSELKIDQRFTRRIETDKRAQAIVTAIANIGQQLGLTVVAEGIETGKQRDLLMDLGCCVGQGYLFSPSLEARELSDWCSCLLLQQPDIEATHSRCN